jgi:hypothetical protein
MKTELRRLSTGATTFWKQVFPTFWITVFGGFNLALWLDLLGGAPSPLAAKLATLAVWGGLSAFLIRWSRRLRHVWLDGDQLLVQTSEGGRVRVPLTQVREIRETRFQRVKLISFELARHTPGVGDDFAFVAPLAFQRPFGDHPLVTELSNLKRLQAGHSGLQGHPRLP